MAAAVFRGANVLDESGEFSGPLDVEVDGEGLVVAVGRDLPSDAESVDAHGLFLMPGVFDCHLHLTMSALSPGEALATPPTQAVLETARNARTTLEAGVTFVRDLAGARPRHPGRDRHGLRARARRSRPRS